LPENHYYNSNAMPVEWMEIFENKDTLRELEQESQYSNLFIHSVDRQQIEDTKDPKSFLNKVILKDNFKTTKVRVDISKVNR